MEVKPKITLDTNCLIDLEEERKGHRTILDIIKYWRDGRVELAVVAISAAEKQVDGKRVDNFQQFVSFLEEVGLDGVEILKPIAYFGISYWNWCVMSGDELQRLDHSIHDVLFPNIPYSAPDNEVKKKWKNAKADVLMLWAHIWNKRDVFISRDNNYHIRKTDLIGLGAKEISTPEEFLNSYVSEK